ncbi:MAG TPA: fibronectin type III domain-containing protein [Steroidobacteraceae bacterium]|nr:fibronectin type III domain-containing protein [Steroidobacteraceae bacterium]
MMMFRGIGSPRIAQLALAALICASLAACNDSGSSAASTGVATSATSGASLAGPTDKSVTLSWSPPTRNSDGSSISNLAGYTLHYGTSSEDYTGSIEITNPTATSYVVSDSNFPRGTYYFSISAYNAQQVSSSLSGEVSVTVD